MDERKFRDAATPERSPSSITPTIKVCASPSLICAKTASRSPAAAKSTGRSLTPSCGVERTSDCIARGPFGSPFARSTATRSSADKTLTRRGPRRGRRRLFRHRSDGLTDLFFGDGRLQEGTDGDEPQRLRRLFKGRLDAAPCLSEVKTPTLDARDHLAQQLQALADNFDARAGADAGQIAARVREIGDWGRLRAEVGGEPNDGNRVCRRRDVVHDHVGIGEDHIGIFGDDLAYGNERIVVDAHPLHREVLSFRVAEGAQCLEKRRSEPVVRVGRLFHDRRRGDYVENRDTVVLCALLCILWDGARPLAVAYGLLPADMQPRKVDLHNAANSAKLYAHSVQRGGLNNGIGKAQDSSVFPRAPSPRR